MAKRQTQPTWGRPAIFRLPGSSPGGGNESYYKQGENSMTIAICALTNEGVILGSDSTTTVSVPTPQGGRAVAQLFNSAQKIFEIGPRVDGFVSGKQFSGALLTFGQGSFGPISWRDLVNQFYCAREATMRWDDDIPQQFSEFCRGKWSELQSAGLANGPLPDAGCFIGAVAKGSHTVQAASVVIQNGTVERLNRGDMKFRGASDAVCRIIKGFDPALIEELSKHNVDKNLVLSCAQRIGISPFAEHMPLRDAIDFVHFLVYATIKLHRYKGGAPLVGGPIEIAALTADRGFRWILHKPLSESIGTTRTDYLV